MMTNEKKIIIPTDEVIQMRYMLSKSSYEEDTVIPEQNKQKIEEKNEKKFKN